MSNKYFMGTDIGHCNDLSVIIILKRKGNSVIIVHSQYVDLRQFQCVAKEEAFKEEIKRVSNYYGLVKNSTTSLTMFNWLKGVSNKCTICHNSETFGSYRYRPKFKDNKLVSLECKQCKSLFIRDGEFLKLKT